MTGTAKARARPANMPKSTELKRLPADVAAESHTTSAHAVSHTTTNVNSAPKPKQRSRRKNAVDEDEDSAKRRCVSTACIACR